MATKTLTLRIPYALRSGVLYSANEVEKDEAAPFTCPWCEEDVVLKKGNTRAHHFSHSSHSECGLAKGATKAMESVQHRRAKQLLCTHLPRWAFEAPCLTCSVVQRFQWMDPREFTAAEELRYNDGEFVLDAGIVANGNVVAAIEVLNTHAIGVDKRGKLERAGVIVVEVKAQEVIESHATLTFKLRDAGVTKSVLQCSACQALPWKQAARDLVLLLRDLPELCTWQVKCPVGHAFEWKPLKNSISPKIVASEEPSGSVKRPAARPGPGLPEVARCILITLTDTVKTYVCSLSSCDSAARAWTPPKSGWWTFQDQVLKHRRDLLANKDGSIVLQVRTEESNCIVCKKVREHQRQERARQEQELKQRKWQEKAEEDRKRQEAEAAAEAERLRLYTLKKAEEDRKRQEAERLRLYTLKKAEEDQKRQEAERLRLYILEKAEEDRKRKEADAAAEVERLRLYTLKKAEEDQKRQEAERLRLYMLEKAEEDQKRQEAERLRLYMMEKAEEDRKRQERSLEKEQLKPVAKRRRKEETKINKERQQQARFKLRGSIKEEINNWLTSYQLTFWEQQLSPDADAVYDGEIHLNPEAPLQDVVNAPFLLHGFMDRLDALVRAEGLPSPQTLETDGQACALRFRILYPS